MFEQHEIEYNYINKIGSTDTINLNISKYSASDLQKSFNVVINTCNFLEIMDKLKLFPWTHNSSKIVIFGSSVLDVLNESNSKDFNSFNDIDMTFIIDDNINKKKDRIKIIQDHLLEIDRYVKKNEMFYDIWLIIELEGEME